MRTNDLKSRIRAAYNIVRYGRGHFRMMTCGKCGSIIIHRISENEVNTNFIKNALKSIIWMKKCTILRTVKTKKAMIFQ